ncbi:type I DNA topoisomerase [Candidatus Saccharibacteria bacterium]|nr:type I DNA topoisomerase [Candidatus Saccharibacteria bacterium]
MAKNLVIVESPAKAHTIEKYLGSDFKVLASVGHIRKDVEVDKDSFDVKYEIDPEHKSVINNLKREAKKADKIWLATDEDREGESISWHLCEVLKLPKNTARITFHEITKPALESAIKNPRTVDMDMVSSQQARQTLDMLVGYDLSGIVRKKVPGAISAGRVQSPALRLVVERENEIEKFESKFNFKITGEFATKDAFCLGSRPSVQKPRADGANSRAAALRNSPSQNVSFVATYDGESPETEEDASRLLESLSSSNFTVTDIEKTDGFKANPTPFTTAALQIEANAKLGFASRTTMAAAQSLYQAGLITYHRTDSLNLSSQAIVSISGFIEKSFGKNYLKVRHFKTKDASAQEAHEAIRPTDITRATAGRTEYEKKLYHLIWARTLATQMANAKVSKTTIKITADTADKDSFSAKGEVVVFDGFLKVYGKSKDLELPNVKKGDKLDCLLITARQTFAKPPARFTEGSLVKKLEELGIGRPSTYATIMTAIQARNYVIKGESEGEEREIVELTVAPSGNESIKRNVVKEKFGANNGRLIPTPIGELVAGFLTDNFDNIVDYKFTANIEKDLDLIADAKLERVKMLKDFYKPFRETVLKADGVERYNNVRLLGHHPETGQPIYAKVGKKGGFIQMGDNNAKKGEKTDYKPRFAPLPKRKTVKSVTLEQALEQLKLPVLPRELGKAPDGTAIIAADGPFGPFLKGGKYNISIKNLDPYTITFEEALPLYQAKIDSIIADWGEIMIINGVYGPYIKGPGRRNNVKIPKETDPKTITEEKAREMLENKPKTRRGVRGGRKKKTTKKTTKKAAKKTAKKKATRKKTGKTTRKTK